MLCLACDCIAVKTWTGALPFWIDGVSVKRDHVAFKMVIFFLFLRWRWEKPTSLRFLISVPASTSSWVMCSWVLALSMGSESLVRQQHRGAKPPLVRGFPRWLLWKTSLRTAIHYHEHSLLKGDREKGDTWYVWGICPDGSNLAVAIGKHFAYLTEIVHSC